jgi:hypothetical protein
MAAMSTAIVPLPGASLVGHRATGPVIGCAPGFRQLSGITIPEIWSGRLLVKFYEATEYSAVLHARKVDDEQA